MKLTYLGTAAAEGFPALFCHCPHCNEARNLGGKSIRTRSQALINDDLLIDLPADTYHHMLKNGIEGDKTLLYAHDTGYFYEEVFTFIEKSGWVFDMVSLDCTNVHIPIPDDGLHMGFPGIGRLLDRLTKIGAVNESTVRYVNHFSHNARPLHPLLKEAAAAYGFIPSYDGCQVTF